LAREIGEKQSEPIILEREHSTTAKCNFFIKNRREE
jgi:hypothetical protein